MKESAGKISLWRVGDLARAAGVSVRALHHYEHMGLLACDERTSSGHRLYGAEAVERVYQILVLRNLGLSLEEIRKSLGNQTAIPELLRRHLYEVEQEMVRLEGLRDRLRALTNATVHPETDDLLATLDAMSCVERHADLRSRVRRTSDCEIERRWRVAGEQLRYCMEAGEAPSSDQARGAGLVVRELINDFANGKTNIIDSLARLRIVDPPDGLAGWDRELSAYLDSVLAALDKDQP